MNNRLGIAAVIAALVIAGYFLYTGVIQGKKYQLAYLMPANTQFDLSVDRAAATDGRSPEGKFSLTTADRVVYGVEVIGPLGNALDLEIEYRDRSHTSDDPEAEDSTRYADLVGQRVRAAVMPDGRLTLVRGFEKLPEVPMPDERRVFVEQDYIGELAGCFIRLPADPVGVGDSWTYETQIYEQLVIGHVKTVVSAVATVEDVTRKNGIDCLKCVGEYDLDIRIQSIVPVSDLPIEIALTGHGTETFYFAFEKGMLLSSVTEIQLEGMAVNTRIGLAAPLTHDARRSVEIKFLEP